MVKVNVVFAIKAEIGDPRATIFEFTAPTKYRVNELR